MSLDDGDNVLSGTPLFPDGGPLVDWDDVASKIAGPEGGLRYFRLGIVLVVLGIIALAAVGFTPIFSSDEVSLTYDSMAQYPDGDPFGVPNSHALGHARWALVGSGLTILMGLILVLEGKRVINLRRLLPWHAEARATALFSMAATLSSIGLFAGASLMGLATSMPTGSADGITVAVQASSPAAIVVVATMGLAVAGMLGMAYYNCVLSVYRGGGDIGNRRMARFTMSLAFMSVASIMMLRLGTIMSATVSLAVGPDTTIDLVYHYTSSRIDHQATLGANEAIKGTLDWQLTIASALLFLSFLGAMAGLVGTSARSLGGNTLRVRRAAAMPTTAIVMMAIALLGLAWASATAGDAARESWGIDDLDVTLGWGLYAGVVLALGALVGALGYLRGLGMEFAKEALAFWRKAEPSEEDVEDEGIHQPMLDQALAEEARAAEAEAAGTEGAPLPSIDIKGHRFTMKPRRMQIILFAVIIAVIIVIAMFVPGGPGGGGGNGDEETIVITDLPTFSEDHVLSEYLSEGDTLNYNALGTILQGDPETTVYFVDQVSLRLAWVDEPDAGLLWTNTADTFGTLMIDNQGLASPERGGTNAQGGQGTVEIDWYPDAWFVYGNSDLVGWGNQLVYEDSDVSVSVTMEAAGDQVTPLGRTQTDGGNSFSLTVTVSGRVYAEGAGGQ